MSAWAQVAVGTSHGELRQLSAAAGAVVVDSAADIDQAVKSAGIRGVMVTQELDGLTADQVRQWAQERAVAIWLEDSPPPAWRGLPTTVTVWCGELDEPTVEAWVASLLPPAGFGDDGQVVGVLGLAGGVGVTSTVWAWGQQLAARRGPTTWVDADWCRAGLTEKLAPHAWRDGSLRPVPCTGGRLLPAPPPWEVVPAEHGPGPHDLEERAGGVVVADLGSDLRQWASARWASAADHVVLMGHANQGERATQMVGLLRELNPTITVAVKGLNLPARQRGLALGLADGWPNQAGAAPAKGGRRVWRDWFQSQAVGVFSRFTPGSR